MRPRRALLALLLLAVAVPATADDPELLYGYPPAVPVFMGGTGSRDFTVGKCVTAYDAGNSVIKLTSSQLDCPRGTGTPTPTPTPTRSATPTVTVTATPGGTVYQVGDCTGPSCFDGGPTLQVLSFGDGSSNSVALSSGGGNLLSSHIVYWGDFDGVVVVACKAPLTCSNGQVAMPTPTPAVTPTPTLRACPTADNKGGIYALAANGAPLCLPTPTATP